MALASQVAAYLLPSFPYFFFGISELYTENLYIHVVDRCSLEGRPLVVATPQLLQTPSHCTCWHWPPSLMICLLLAVLRVALPLRQVFIGLSNLWRCTTYYAPPHASRDMHMCDLVISGYWAHTLSIFFMYLVSELFQYSHRNIFKQKHFVPQRTCLQCNHCWLSKFRVVDSILELWETLIVVVGSSCTVQTRQLTWNDHTYTTLQHVDTGL